MQLKRYIDSVTLFSINRIIYNNMIDYNIWLGTKI